MPKPKFDPYAELELDRGATTAQVRAAYRKRAKATHPDVPGGNVEDFADTKRALVVLTNPRKRKQFDQTGDVEEEKPDNERAAALQVIEQFVNDTVDAFLTGKDPDPRARDLSAEFWIKVNEDIRQAESAWRHGEKVIAFLEDMRKRFTTDDPSDPIGRSFDLKVERAKQQRADIRESITIRQHALKIMAGYRFNADGFVTTGF